MEDSRTGPHPRTGPIRELERIRGLARIRVAATVSLGVASIGLVFHAVTIVTMPGLLGLAERVRLAGILGWALLRGVGILRLSPRSSGS